MYAPTIAELALFACIFAAAILYSSVGHAGASGYLAAMALFTVPPDHMRPAALVLNILVATIATIRFAWSGYFAWRIFWPFALASVPFAYLGGSISVPGYIYKPLVAMVMLFAAYRLFRNRAVFARRRIPAPAGLACGAVIGLLSGLTGTGGGIFLSPLLLLTGWAETKESSGVSAAFILVNSIAGILGLMTRSVSFPAMLPYWAVAALLGGLVGSELGSRRLGNPMLRGLLSLVLVIAALKLMLT